MGFNNCKILYFCQSKPWYQYRIENEGIEGSPAEKNIEGLVDEKLEIIW